jgi:hypothetical protein
LKKQLFIGESKHTDPEKPQKLGINERPAKAGRGFLIRSRTERDAHHEFMVKICRFNALAGVKTERSRTRVQRRKVSVTSSESKDCKGIMKMVPKQSGFAKSGSLNLRKATSQRENLKRRNRREVQ